MLWKSIKMTKMKKKRISVSPEEFNQILDDLDEAKIQYSYRQNKLYVEIETLYDVFQCMLIKSAKNVTNPGAVNSAFFSKCDVDIITDQYGYKKSYNSLGIEHISWNYGVAYGYSYTSPYDTRRWLKCWSYDVNSAFAYGMLNPMPDTARGPKNGLVVSPGEMGFYIRGGATTEVGAEADIVFPLMPSPFVDYVNYHYEKKKNAADAIIRRKEKDFLNIPTGLLCKKNIFLRNAIIYYSNEYIKSFIDDDTVYCNVDCIVSKKPRDDIPIGIELGQFKAEHINDNFKYIQNCQYQWNTDCHYSGIPRGLITDIEHTENWYENLDYIVINRKVYENENKKQKANCG